MNNPLVSVIIPVYNGEKYISNILNSLKHQTFNNFEVIIINDGSTDNTENIINKFLDDKRFIYIKNSKNLYLKQSRKIGFNTAKGKYICPIDCDDNINNDYLSSLLELAESNKLDICLSRIVSVNFKTKKQNDDFNLNNSINVFDKTNKLKELFKRRYGVWGSIARKDFLLKQKYDYSGAELEFFSFLFYKSARVGYSNSAIYYFYRYNQSTSSITNAPKKLADQSNGKNYSFNLNLLSNIKDELITQYSSYILRAVLPLLMQRSLYEKEYDWKADYKKLKSDLKFKNYYFLKTIKYVSKFNKKILLLMYLHAESFIYRLLSRKYHKSLVKNNVGRICLIGNSGTKANLNDGQVIKVRLYKELIATYKQINFVDLQDAKKKPIKTLLNIKRGIDESERIILITAAGGSRILIPLINFINKSNKPFILPMIGINILHRYIDKLSKEKQFDFMSNNNFYNIKPYKTDLRNLRKITYILPENEMVMNTIEKFFGIDNVYVLENFRINTKKYMPHENASTPIKLVYLSRVMEKKGVFEIINSVNKINEDNVNYTLDIYGKIYLNEEELSIFKKFMSNTIDYKGVLDNNSVIDALSKYDLFVFPTKFKSEGTPGVISESLIAGTPVLSSNFAQANILLKNGSDSIIYDMDSICDLYNKLKYLSINKALLKEMSKNALNNAKRFTYENSKDKFLKYICGVSDKI